MDRGPVALFGAIVAIGLGPAMWLGAQFGNIEVAPARPPATVGEHTSGPDDLLGGAGAGDGPADDTVIRSTPQADQQTATSSPSASPSPSDPSPIGGPTSATPSASSGPTSATPSTPPTESTTEPTTAPTGGTGTTAPPDPPSGDTDDVAGRTVDG